MTVEDLYDKLGGFGRFHLFIIASIFSMKFMVGWSMMLMSFAGMIPDYYCHTEETDTWDNETFYSNITFNKCSVNGTPCISYEFIGSKRTVISEWGLICDLKWIKATITSVQMVGVLVGAVLAGHLGDMIGRKKTTYGFYIGHALLNVVAAFSITWQMFTVLRFFIGMGIGAILVMVVPYPMEFFPIKWRVIIPVIPMWPMGVGFFALVAWFLEDWAHIHLACAAFSVPTILGVFFAPDSLRWLSVHGKLDEAMKVLEMMAKFNRTKVPSNAKQTLEHIAKDERKKGEGKQYSYLDVFRGAAMAKTTIIFAFKWVSYSIVFYGLSFGVSSLSWNIYLNIFLMAFVEVPSNLSTFYFVNKIGRRWTCVGFIAIGTVAAFGCLAARSLVAEDGVQGSLISGLSLVAKVGVGSSWVASQIWVTEVYPTVTRSLGYGTANTASRIGGAIAPFAVNLDESVALSYGVIGGLLLISMFLLAFIPETKGTVLSESLGKKSEELAIHYGSLRAKKDITAADNSAFTKSDTQITVA